MAGRKMKLIKQINTVIICVAVSAWNSACVSTEELYAEYDERLCQLVAEETSEGVVLLREKITNSLFHWEPAVYFDFDDQTLSQEAQTQLLSVLPVLKAYPYLLLSLQGFTDNIGSTSYNRQLANRRVKSVSAFLTVEGIDNKRLVIQTLGKGLKTVGEYGEASRALNRRVELMLLDSKGKPISVSVDPESILLRYLKNSKLPSSSVSLEEKKGVIESALETAPVSKTAVPANSAVSSAVKKESLEQAPPEPHMSELPLNTQEAN